MGNVMSRRSKEGKRERGREGERERGREGKRERVREGKRERGREGKRERGREGKRERGREGKRERGKEGERERGKEGENVYFKTYLLNIPPLHHSFLHHSFPPSLLPSITPSLHHSFPPSLGCLTATGALAGIVNCKSIINFLGTQQIFNPSVIPPNFPEILIGFIIWYCHQLLSK